jgi:hypothetical protein
MVRPTSEGANAIEIVAITNGDTLRLNVLMWLKLPVLPTSQ